MTMTLEQVRDWHLEEVHRLNSYQRHFPNDSTVLAALIMHHQSMADAIAARLTQTAQSVDVEKVRRVAADIRHWNEAICHPALNVFADKLEAAIKGVAP